MSTTSIQSTTIPDQTTADTVLTTGINLNETIITDQSVDDASKVFTQQPSSVFGRFLPWNWLGRKQGDANVTVIEPKDDASDGLH